MDGIIAIDAWENFNSSMLKIEYDVPINHPICS